MDGCEGRQEEGEERSGNRPLTNPLAQGLESQPAVGVGLDHLPHTP